MLSSKADEGTVEAKKRRQAIKKVKIFEISEVLGIFALKVASNHADFFVFESFRRNCPALVVKSAILKLKNKNQWPANKLYFYKLYLLKLF